MRIFRAAVISIYCLLSPVVLATGKQNFTEAVKSIPPVLDAVWPENSSTRLLVVLNSKVSKRKALDVVQLVCQTATEFQRPSFDIIVYQKFPTKKMIRDRCIASR